MKVSGYRAMWVFVMFDLPVKTKPQRRKATVFRKNLLKDGFQMIQFSVYSRPCPTDENATVHLERVKRWLPERGHVRILKFTDAQYARTLCFQGKIVTKAEMMPPQLELF